MSERFFTVESSETHKTGGRYSGSTPSSAAVKAARVLFREHGGKKKEIRFTIRETTQGSEGKSFTYIGEKTKLRKPRVIIRGDTEIKIKHVYSVKSCSM